MRPKALLIIFVLCLPLVLSGCSLLPLEEEIKTAPVLRTEPPLAFHFETVRREDLIKT